MPWGWCFTRVRAASATELRDTRGQSACPDARGKSCSDHESRPILGVCVRAVERSVAQGDRAAVGDPNRLGREAKRKSLGSGAEQGGRR